MCSSQTQAKHEAQTQQENAFGRHAEVFDLPPDSPKLGGFPDILPWLQFGVGVKKANEGKYELFVWFVRRVPLQLSDVVSWSIP